MLQLAASAPGRSASRRRHSFVILIHPKDHQSVTVSSSHTQLCVCLSVSFFLSRSPLGVHVLSRSLSSSFSPSPSCPLLPSHGWLIFRSTWDQQHFTEPPVIASILSLALQIHCAASDLIEQEKEGRTNWVFSFLCHLIHVHFYSNTDTGIHTQTG